MKRIGLSKRNGIITAIISLPVFMAGQGTLQLFSPATTSTYCAAMIGIALICSAILAIFQTIWTKKICVKALKESIWNIEQKLQNRPSEQRPTDKKPSASQDCDKNSSQIIELTAYMSNSADKNIRTNFGFIRNDLGKRTYDRF